MADRLFDMPPKPRRKPRKLMHVYDAGDCGFDAGKVSVRFRCDRCGHKTDWQFHMMSEAKRGIPCPTCNAKVPE